MQLTQFFSQQSFSPGPQQEVVQEELQGLQEAGAVLSK
jgi:hypothetical protein